MSEESRDQPEEFADIRALLAGAKESGPTPAEVVARLDATLADLTAGRRRGLPEEPATAEPVVPLRRRSHAPQRLLVAAAAVLVVAGAGVGITKALEHGTNQAASSSASATDRGVHAAVPETQPSGVGGTGGSTATSTAGGAGSDDAAGSDGRPLPALTRADFGEGVATLVAGKNLSLNSLDATKSGSAVRGAVPAPSAPVPNASTPGTFAPKTLDAAPKSAPTAACVGPTGTGGDLEPITLDGAPAVLVIHPVVDHHRLVEAWSCDGSTVLASTTLPHR
ncbi:MAG TPA: hypothetical protein VHZ06_00475 [Marmoricola sp.]|jgi:hypothetical protein|nr:hypothetical protein [Marmoricola sp.]